MGSEPNPHHIAQGSMAIVMEQLIVNPIARNAICKNTHITLAATATSHLLALASQKRMVSGQSFVPGIQML